MIATWRKGAVHARALAENTAVQVVLIVWLHGVLYGRLFQHSQLPFKAYFEPYLVAQLLKDYRPVFLALVPLLALVLARRHTTWAAIDPQKRTRWFIWIVAGIFAWAFSTYDVNLFYDQSHWLDRLLLIGLWIGLFFHPMALMPFLVLVVAIGTQQHYPLPEGPWTWPDKRLPLDILCSFAAYTLVRAVLGDRLKPFLPPLLFLCVIGWTYGHAAINKALLGEHLYSWVLHDDLGNLLVSSYLNNGWLRGLGDDGIISFAHVLHAIKVPLALATLLVELSGFALVIRWKLTRALLPLFFLFHLGVLSCSGIFFWKWMIVDGCLLWLLWRLRKDAEETGEPAAATRVDFFKPRVTALAVAIMFAARFYFELVPFAWFDTKLTNYFEIYGVAERGQRYRLEPRFFAPYDIHIVQSRHYQAVQDTVLVGTFGSTLDWRVAEALEHASKETLPELHRRYGQRWTHRHFAFGFFEFVRRYVVNAQRRGGRRSIVSWIAPPFHFQHGTADDAFDFQERLMGVEIEFREYLYDGERIELTRKLPVIRFKLQSGS